MNLIAATLLALGLLPALAVPQESSKDLLMAGNEILARHAAETGSPEARAAIQSLRLVGKLEVPGMPEGFGALEVEEIHVGDAARQTTESTVEAMKMTMTMGSTGTWSWSTDPALGVTIREGKQGAVVQRMFAVFRGASPLGMYDTVEPLRYVDVDGKRCVEVQANPPGGAAETWFFDTETGLLARFDVELPNPEPGAGSLPVQFLFSDYEAVNGLKVARTRTQKVGAMTLTYRFESIEANAEFAAERLAPPADVQVAFDDPQRVRQGADDSDDAVKLVMVEARPLASIRATIPEAEISASLAVMLPEVWGHLTEVGAQMDGPPLTRIHSRADGKVDLEAGIPLKKPIEASGRIQASTLPAGLMATTWHVGPYHELSRTHERLEAWLAETGHVQRGGGWEIYWTDPGIQPDPAKWRTQVVFPIDSEVKPEDE